MSQNQRNAQRINLSIPIQLIFGTQITLKGQLKDISVNSAFITIKSSVHMATNDELKFVIDNLPNIEGSIQGRARISRVAPGEGIAIYFTEMNKTSLNNLQRLING